MMSRTHDDVITEKTKTDRDVISVKHRILAEHRKYASCGMYGTKMETPETWAEIAAIKILSDVRRGDLK